MPIIKTLKTSVPSENGRDLVNFVQKISVDKDGRFTIKAPDHLLNTFELVSKERKIDQTVEGDDYYQRRLAYDSQKGVVGPCARLDDVIDAWDSLVSRARKFLTESARTKVIMINTEMHVSIIRDNQIVLNRKDISFSNVRPTLGLDYTVCYLAGQDLIDEDNHYLANPERATYVPHTPEREAFLAKMVYNLEQAALQLDEFCQEVDKDPRAIDGFIKKGLLLSHDEES